MKEETKKTKKKFNKKYLMFGILGLFALALISAIAYFSFFTATFSVTPLIGVTGAGDKTFLDVQAPTTILGDEITLTNNGGEGSEVIITSEVVDGDLENVEVSYVGELRLSKKVVVFGSSHWIEVEGTDLLVDYTIVGDEFSAEVLTPITDYVLIYYADNTDRFNNVAKAVNVEDVDANLPYVGDQNAEGGEYDMCLIEGYDACHGAKIWYVPSGAISSEGDIDWSQASNFYFETDLVQYNSNGEIVIYPTEVLDFTPVYDFDEYASGTYTITTTIA